MVYFIQYRYCLDIWFSDRYVMGRLNKKELEV